MRVIASIVVLIASACACTAFNVNQAASGAAVSRRDIFNGIASAGVAAAVLSQRPPAAVAKEAAPLPPISGIYSDPNHAGGYRIVRAVDRSNAIVTLQDEPSGPVISVTGKVRTSKSAGTTVTLDLSPKGGPKDVVAKLVGDDQLAFPDGNAWTKIGGVDGVYSDPNHPAGYRAVRAAPKGSKVYVTLQDEPAGETIELVGKRRGNGSVLIDFSPKGGPKNLEAVIDAGKLVFPDGNSWTKL